jgi:hypothetical protein
MYLRYRSGFWWHGSTLLVVQEHVSRWGRRDYWRLIEVNLGRITAWEVRFLGTRVHYQQHVVEILDD